MTSLAIGKCDSCGVSVAEVVRFSVGIDQNGSTIGPLVDLCDDCEARMLAALEPFLGEDDARDLRRDES